MNSAPSADDAATRLHPRLRWFGTDAVLAEFDSLDQAIAARTALALSPVTGQLEIVAGARTVLVRLDLGTDHAMVEKALLQLPSTAADVTEPALIEIPVLYDGEDLTDVSELLDISVDALIGRHIGADWIAAFGGFAPGFSYLAAAGSPVVVPRRASPRTRVPAGSVGLAGEFTGIYPRVSPGGWQLIGRTAVKAWDLSRSAPALISAGDHVRFVAVRELIAVEVAAGSCADALPSASPSALPSALPTALPRTQANPARDRADDPRRGSALEILEVGLLATVQDLGRPGLADLGVSPSGAADRGAHRRANRAVGNDPSSATLEVLAGGLALRCRGDQVLAVTGARAPLTLRHADAEGGDIRLPLDTPFAVIHGDLITLAPATHGLRSYVAVRGGIDEPTVLGSRSTDTLSGLGPAPVSAGRVLDVGPSPRAAVDAQPFVERIGGLAVTLGARRDWFTDASVRALLDTEWCVSPDSDRIGVRLQGGQPLERITGSAGIAPELPSEGMIAGVIQVPPDGMPLIFLADHPVTGGYPVIGVIDRLDLDRVAQLPPGEPVRFTLRH